jgi:mono/diheme cytochrome c family protein
VSGLILGIVLLVVTAVLVFVATRVRRIKSNVRWPAMIVVGFLAMLVAVVSVVDVVGVYRLNVPYNSPVPDVKVTANAEQIARGQHLANICSSCHSTTGSLPLDGAAGSILSSPGNPGLGSLYAPNLTPGGPLATWTDGEIVRAIRDGVDKDGHALVLMPSPYFHAMSDADVQAIVAYLRTQPAVSHSTPPRDLNLLGMLLIGSGAFPTSVQPSITTPVSAPPAGPTADYGRYLVTISGCQVCHGDDFAGGRRGAGPPAGPNLTLLVPRWSEADFVTTIRTGTDPNGYHLSTQMPWKQFSAAYSDDELKAIYSYLHGLPPLQVPPR